MPFFGTYSSTVVESGSVYLKTTSATARRRHRCLLSARSGRQQLAGLVRFSWHEFIWLCWLEFVAAFPAKTLPPATVSFFTGAPSEKFRSDSGTQKALGLVAESK